MKTFFPFILLALLIVTSCVSGQPVGHDWYPRQQPPPNPPLRLPHWLMNPPDSSVIGIAYATRDTLEFHEAARQFATVQSARNRGSYHVDKYAGSEYGTAWTREYREAAFRRVVSNRNDLAPVYNDLHQRDHLIFDGWYIALFNESEDIDSSLITVYPDSIPKWFTGELSVVENGAYMVRCSAEASDLIDAYALAESKARLGLAGLFSRKVNSSVLLVDDALLSNVSLETVQEVVGTRITRFGINRYYRENHWYYRVFIEIRKG